MRPKKRPKLRWEGKYWAWEGTDRPGWAASIRTGRPETFLTRKSAERWGEIGGRGRAIRVRVIVEEL